MGERFGMQTLNLKQSFELRGDQKNHVGSYKTTYNRHIILGDYEDADINRIMTDYGKKVADLLFMKYEEMGMDTENKRKEYAMLVVMMVDIVHSAYKRALRGGERRSLREMISVNQSNSTNMQGTPQNPTGQQQTRGLLNPMRYVRGKYV